MSIKFPDKIIVVSLPHRVDRREVIATEMQREGIEFEFFDAVKHETGKLGLLQSMRILLEQCLAKRYFNVWVLEDDASPLLTPVRPFLNTILSQVPYDYHMLYLGGNLISQPRRVSENLLEIAGAYSTHSIIYSRAGMALAVEQLRKGNQDPYDIILMQHVQLLRKCYITYPMLMTQRTTYSDIENREINWGHLMNTMYIMQTKNIHMVEQIPCKNGHAWEGVVPGIDASKLQPQFPDLWGKECDCKKVKIMGEKACSCGVPRWEFVMAEN